MLLLRQHSWYILKKLPRFTPSVRSKMTQACSMSDRLVWVDLEMTGLDISKDHIIEMACLVTDGQLNMIAEGPNLIIHQPDHIMDSMGEWCKEHHGESGLTQAVKESNISLSEAEGIMTKFLAEHTAKGAGLLAGNSVHADKVFLVKYMPNFMEYLHYRIMDVSTVKELCRRWYPEQFQNAPKKGYTHRALDDIRESIKELQYYRQAIFK